MPKKAHTEEQIVAVLQQGQAGRRWRISAARWGSVRGPTTHGGSTIRRLRHYRIARTAPAAGREQPLEAAGGGSQPGSADPAGDRVKNALKPGLRGRLGQWAWGASTSRPCCFRWVRIRPTIEVENRRFWLRSRTIRLSLPQRGKCNRKVKTFSSKRKDHVGRRHRRGR
jgi:hypothetical protein